MIRLRLLGHSVESALRLMKYGAWMLRETLQRCASVRIASQAAGEIRTERTQASSSASRSSSAIRWMPPTVPPGLGGVESGLPTVPKRNLFSIGCSLCEWFFRFNPNLDKLL